MLGEQVGILKGARLLSLTAETRLLPHPVESEKAMCRDFTKL